MGICLEGVMGWWVDGSLFLFFFFFLDTRVLVLVLVFGVEGWGVLDVG